jgi:hypothetical protein
MAFKKPVAAKQRKERKKELIMKAGIQESSSWFHSFLIS